LNQLWSIYNRFASSKSSVEQRELKNEFMRVRKELNATSSQDEFAKWAKLRRQHDKLLEQLEKTSTLFFSRQRLQRSLCGGLD
jgi:hypothetical protein